MLNTFRFQAGEVFQIVINCFPKREWSMCVFIKTKDTGFHRKAGGVQYIHYMSEKKDEAGGETWNNDKGHCLRQVIQGNRIIIQ